DNGKAIRETAAEVGAVGEMYYYWAGAADKVQGETIRVGPQSFNFTLHEPIGVVGAIIPWNSPLSLFAAKVGAILAAGATACAKPAQGAASTSLALARFLAAAGLPP